MIIDFHTHVFPDDLAERALSSLLEGIDAIFTPVTDATIAGLLSHMAGSGVAFPSSNPSSQKQSQFQDLNNWAGASARTG